MSPLIPIQVSAYRSQMKIKERTASGASLKVVCGRKPRQLAESGQVTAIAKAIPTGDSAMIDDLAAVKHLVQRLGAEQVRKIVGLFE
jgi:hypothetical protein